MRAALTASILVLALTGCQLLESFRDPPVLVNLEIHNRTLDPLVYENTQGQRVEVPACESLRVQGFGVNTVSVRAPGGHVRSFGMTDPGEAGGEFHLVEVGSAVASGIPERGPAPALPACEDRAEAQPGT